MKIIGIDPGTARIGYGIIKKLEKMPRIIPNGTSNCNDLKNCFSCIDYGLIETTPDLAMPQRLKKLNDELSFLIRSHKPDVLVVESVYFFKNLKTVMPVSQAKGVILLTAAKNKIPVYELTPLQVKIALTGFGRAEKENVQKMISSILGFKEAPKPDDVADALAIALAHCLYVKTS